MNLATAHDDLLKMKIDPSLRSAISDLLERKKVATEGEYNPHIPAIRDFIQAELQRQKQISSELVDDRNTDYTALNLCFARAIGLQMEASI